MAPHLSEIAHAVARGERSAAEVVEASIARIEATDAHVNAFTGRRFEAARAQAARIDEQRARGEPLGPLAGVPFAVKNLFDIAGEVTLAGSKVNRSYPPATANAVLVERLQAAGAVLVGSLNMDEYAYGFTTENTHYGPCHNPHRLGHVAGGSSGGSGAAVAAGQVPLALGSDTNGSIRVPSSFCGVWGLKPTFGRLSRRGSYPFVNSIDHLGPFADDLDGLALAYDALQGPDPLDPGCFATQVQPVSRSLGQGVQGLRVGVLGGYFVDHASGPAREAVALAAAALGASAMVEWPDRRAPPPSSPAPAKAVPCTCSACAHRRPTSSRCRWTASSRARCSPPPGTCARSAFGASTATRSTPSFATGTCSSPRPPPWPRHPLAPSGSRSMASASRAALPSACSRSPFRSPAARWWPRRCGPRAPKACRWACSSLPHRGAKTSRCARAGRWPRPAWHRCANPPFDEPHALIPHPRPPPTGALA